LPLGALHRRNDFVGKGWIGYGGPDAEDGLRFGIIEMQRKKANANLRMRCDKSASS
jgi:hypothetical protein